MYSGARCAVRIYGVALRRVECSIVREGVLKEEFVEMVVNRRML